MASGARVFKQAGWWFQLARAITVASQKGGVGKTTTVINLAASLCLAGRKVLLMDLDPQANATSGVGVEVPLSGSDEFPYLSALLNGEELEPFFCEAEFENLWVLPSSPEASDLGVVRKLEAADAGALRGRIRDAAEAFDYVILDCPPSLSGLPTLALELSDGLIIPVQCEYYAMEGLSQILPLVKKIQKSTNPDLEIEGLLLTMFSQELDLSQDVLDQVAEFFEGGTFTSVIPRDVLLAEATSHGCPAFQYDCESKGAWAYVELAREVMENG